MAGFTATTLQEALFHINRNMHEMFEVAPEVDMQAKLRSWREAFFPLLDRNIPEENVIHQWIVPTLALENDIDPTLTWWEIGDVVALVARTIAALVSDGYTVPPALEASFLSAYNATWVV